MGVHSTGVHGRHQLSIRAGIATAGCVVACWYHLLLLWHMRTDLSMNDFGKFYFGARAFLEGQSLYGLTPATTAQLDGSVAYQMANLNPPHFHFLVLPFASMTPDAALAVWMVFSVLCLLLSLRIALREIGVRVSPNEAIYVFFAVVTFPAFRAFVATGQLALVLMLPITIAWRAARHANWMRAALLVGACASVKPFVGVLAIVLLVGGGLRAVLVSAGTAAALTGAGLWFFGVRSYEAWLAGLSGIDWAWLPMNCAALGWLSRSFGPSAFYVPLTDVGDTLAPAAYAAAALVLGITAIALTRPEISRDVDRSVGIALLGAQLVGPLGWLYYWWFVVPAALSLSARMLRDRGWQRNLMVAALAGLYVPIEVVVRLGNSGLATATVGSLPFWSTFGLWLAMLTVRTKEGDPLMLPAKG